MTLEELYQQIITKQSYLCVGLDTDIQKIPPFLLEESENPILEFNKRIIDATKDFCVSYKFNIAFYECLGPKGWEILEASLDHVPDNIFTIADAKRGDIGNTSRMYAQTFFERYNFDSVTVAPYMGIDSVSPFLEYDDKWVILLALTSNKGSADFQFLESKEGKLYESVLKTAQNWASEEELMFVTGATHPEELANIREIAPKSFFLIPGVGAQGGNVQDVSHAAVNDKVGMLVNSSRGVIYASNDRDFELAAQESAKDLQQQMASFLKSRSFL